MVTERGLRGDRAFAVIDDASGKVASAKHPALWRELLLYSARILDEESMSVEVTTPRGHVHGLPGSEAGTALSNALKRPVRFIPCPPAELRVDRLDPDSLLAMDAPATVVEQGIGAGAPQGTFFDFGPLHIITTNTLAALSPAGVADLLDAARFRANVIVDCPGGDGFVENAWVGRTLRFGSQMTAKVITPTPRCAIPTLEHAGLPANLETLRTLVKRNRLEVRGVGVRPCAGVYARPIRLGKIEVGAPVDLVD